MTPNEMLCHLADAFDVALGARPVAPADTWMLRTVIKYVAFHTSLAWPHGRRTPPEVEQGVGGTRPVDFERDRARAIGLLQPLRRRGRARTRRIPSSARSRETSG